MKIILTEQQLQNVVNSMSSDLDFEKIAPNLSAFGKNLMKSRLDFMNQVKKTSDNDETEVESPDEVKPSIKTTKKSSLDMAHPLGKKTKITSGFGQRIHPTMKHKDNHMGVDISVPSGSNVYSPLDGVVMDSRNAGGRCGGFIRIRHENLITKYCHLSKLLVKKGDDVRRGDVIGLSGGGKDDPMRGTSTGSHLHYEIQDLNGRNHNPLQIQPNLG